VLEDRRGGLGEEPDQAERAVEVEQVVIRKLLAVENSGASKARPVLARLDVERGSLVGVLAVAKHSPTLEAGRDDGGEGYGIGLRQVLGDGSVVAGGLLEDRQRERAPGYQGRPASLPELLDEAGVLLGRGEHGHVGMVLGCPADQAGAADVDVLDRLLEADAGLRDCGLEGVKVHDNQVDGVDPLGFEGEEVARHVATGQDAAVELGVEGLEPAAEDLGLAGVARDFRDLKPGLDQGRPGPAAGQQVDPSIGEGPGQVDQPSLVRHAQQRPPDGDDLIHHR
jgi:hypothetical protein